jgi:predicted secreted hydrolase
MPPARSLVAALAAALALLAALAPRSTLPRARTAAGGGARLELGPGPEDVSGFARATTARAFRLPEDHGPHLEYQTEWWYYTGHLDAADGSRYGFQLTFFRRGLTPGPPPAGAGLATNQVYFAHLAVTDVGARRHAAVERFARGAAGLAGAAGSPYSVWLEDWRASATNDDGSRVSLRAADAASGLGLELELEARKPLVAHGDRGLSAKSDEPGNASYYVGYTRLTARGSIEAGGRRAAVEGEAWFDHEWSTSALGTGAVGWDWFSLQLEDGRELMYFQLRRADGSIEGASSGTLVETDGRTRRLAARDVELLVLDRWRSARSGADYPARWKIAVPALDLVLLVEPLLADQEMRTSFLYWEGAVAVEGAAGGRTVRGRGYVELTGYGPGQSMQGVF